MRAIGFSEYTDRKKLKELLTDVIMNSDHRAYTMNQEGILLGEFSKNHTHTKGTIESGTFGVAVCGEFDDNDKFIYEYYFPYLTGSGITSYEDVSVERHADKDSYAGICDDIKVGISLIFICGIVFPISKHKAQESYQSAVLHLPYPDCL